MDVCCRSFWRSQDACVECHLGALDHIERYTSDAHVARLAHETRRQKAKEAAREWKVRLKAALDAEPRREPPAMPIEAIDPGNFIYPRLFASDPTIESLAPLLVARPQGMMLIRDESPDSSPTCAAERWSVILARSLERQPLRRRSAYRKDHSTSRTSSSAVIGGFQPPTSSLARSRVTRTDLRTLPCSHGQDDAGDRPLTNERSRAGAAASRSKALPRLRLKIPAGVFTLGSVPLSDGASASFEEFRQFVDEMKRGLDGRERQWLVKAETSAASRRHTGLYGVGDLVGATVVERD